MPRTRKRTGAVFGVAGAAVAALVTAAPVAAAAPQPAAAAEHCAYNINDRVEKCFTSLDEVEAMVAEAKQDQAAEARVEGHPPGKDIRQGTFFRGRKFRDGTFTVWGSGLCDPADGLINYNYTFPKRWRDVISSVQPWGDCKIWLYPKTDLRGHRDGPYEGNTVFVGSYMNNRTKSVGFS